MIIQLKEIHLEANLKKHYSWEKSDRQNVIIEIEINCNFEKKNPILISDVIDYVKIEGAIIKLVQENQFEIIEHLGNAICKEVFLISTFIFAVKTKISKQNILEKTKEVSIITEKHRINKKIIFSFGSNLGNKLENIKNAFYLIEKECNLTNVNFSNIYESSAWFPENSPKDWNIPFLNCCISSFTDLNPESILSKISEIELKIGRKKDRIKYSPREIDIDIIYYNGEVISNKSLNIPHSELYTRDFVLIPCMEIEPNIFKTDIENNLKIAYGKNIWNN